MKRRVVICTSAKGGLPFWWFDSYAKLLALNHARYTFELSVEAGNSAINISRNIMADHAIREGYDDMVQIDTDMRWMPDNVIQMLDHNQPIICAPYTKKQSGPIRWLVVRKKGCYPDPVTGLCDMDFFGTGMFSVQVPALATMCAAFPERRFTYEDDDAHGGIKQRTMTELFPIGIVGPNTPEGRISRIRAAIAASVNDTECMDSIERILDTHHLGESRFLGEDFFFSHLARKAGFKILCDSRLLIRHIGAAPYPILDEQLSTLTPLPESNLNLDAY